MKISGVSTWVGVFAVTFAALSIATPAAKADATVYVVHGIPGADLDLDPALPVDISANGGCLLEGFTFGEIAGPLAIPAGSYDFAISLADANNPCGGTVVIDAPGVVLEDGVNYSIVAHLTEEGGITASVFENNTNTARYFGNVNVFHTAAAPAVDIEFSRHFFFWTLRNGLDNVSNGDQGALWLYRGDWDLTFYPAGSDDPAFGPIDVSVERETAYLAYAVGSLSSGTFTVLLTAIEEPQPDATVFVVHGIPGADLGLDPNLPVDVSANGGCVLEGFTFGEIEGPLSLPAGTYDLAIGLADANNPCGAAPVIEAPGVELSAGQSYSIVAHLTEDGAPTASVFVNNVGARNPFAKVNIFHTAAAPAVDITLERTRAWWWRPRVLSDVANGDSGSVKLLRGSWDVSIFPAGGDEAVFGPATVALDAKATYLVYAVGSLANETFTLLVGVADDGSSN